MKPTAVEELLAKGQELFVQGQNKEALSCYTEAIKLNPNYSTAYFHKGRALSDLGNYQDAIESYDKAITCNPDDARAHFSKGRALSNLCQNQKALSCYDQAISLEPNYTMAWIAKGCALSDLSQYKNAIVCFDEAIKISPNEAAAFFYMGYALSSLLQNQRAITYFYRAISLDPNYAEYYCNLGKTFIDLEKDEPALNFFFKASEVSKNKISEKYLNDKNIDLTIHTFNKSETSLYQELAELHEANTTIKKVSSTLNLTYKKAAQANQRFESLEKIKNELIGDAIQTLNQNSWTSVTTNKEKLKELETKMIETKRNFLDLKMEIMFEARTTVTDETIPKINITLENNEVKALSKPYCERCHIFSVTEIRYDNSRLNLPDAFYGLAKVGGISWILD